MSNAFVDSGTSDELKFAVTDNVSDVALPIVILPPNAKSPVIPNEPVIDWSPMNVFEPVVAYAPAATLVANVMSPARPPTIRVFKSVFT